jgi:hypothetical protein
MSYTPTIIIKKAQLDAIKSELMAESNSDDGETSFVANYLLYVIHHNCDYEIDGIKLTICQPSNTTDNAAVRKRLNAGKITFSIPIN